MHGIFTTCYCLLIFDKDFFLFCIHLLICGLYHMQRNLYALNFFLISEKGILFLFHINSCFVLILIALNHECEIPQNASCQKWDILRISVEQKNRFFFSIKISSISQILGLIHKYSFFVSNSFHYEYLWSRNKTNKLTIQNLFKWITNYIDCDDEKKEKTQLIAKNKRKRKQRSLNEVHAITFIQINLRFILSIMMNIIAVISVGQNTWEWMKWTEKNTKQKNERKNNREKERTKQRQRQKHEIVDCTLL